ELLGIDENRDDHRARIAPRRFDEGEMSRVQRAHGWNEAREPPFGARLARHLLHPLNSVNDFHAAAARIFLMSGLRRALAVEADEVRADWLGAELAQQRSHLAAMISAVVGQMLECLPKQVAVRIALGVSVIEAALEIGGRKTIDIRQQL